MVTAGGGVARIRESLFHALGQTQGLPGKVVNSVCVDKQGELWTGTMSGGLARWQDGQFVSVPLPASDGDPTASVTVFPENNGGVWVWVVHPSLLPLPAGTMAPPP